MKTKSTAFSFTLFVTIITLIASLPVPSFAVTTTTPTSLTITRNLTPGKRGSDVSSLQQFLIKTSNLKIAAPTGYYGPLTTAAVATWQKTQGITPTGNIGPISRGRLSSSLTSSSDIATNVDATTSATTTSDIVIAPALVSSASISDSGSTASRRRRSTPVTQSEDSVPTASVTSTDPADGATNTPRNRGIKIVFGNAMDASTINATNITVTANGSPVSGTVTYSSIGSSAAFLPNTNFGANAHIMLTVSTDVRNTFGAALPEDYIAEFDASASVGNQTAIDLSNAASYGILANGLANTNPTTITGDLGTGGGGQAFAPSVTGSNHANDSSYTSANLALNNAIIDADTRICDSTENGSVDLGGRTFTPGVYCFGGPNTITGTTTLSTNGVFIFKFGGALTLSSAATVAVVNGASPSNAYWVATATSTFGTSSRFLGNLLAKDSVSAATNAIIDGRLLSRTTVTTTGTTTTSVPGSIYCSIIRPMLATNKAPAPNKTFSVAYVATSTVSITGNLDATGCDVAVYAAPYSSVTVNAATIREAGKVGLFNELGNVDISSSTITNIGDRINGAWRFGGTQTGNGIEYVSSSTGSIIGNTITNYQKIGVVLRSIDGIFIRNNIITGQGTTTMNAQEGLQIGFGTPSKVLSTLNIGNITGNTITGNIYTPSESAFGVLASMLTGQDSAGLTATMATTNSITGNGSMPDEDIIIGEY